MSPSSPSGAGGAGNGGGDPKRKSSRGGSGRAKAKGYRRRRAATCARPASTAPRSGWGGAPAPGRCPPTRRCNAAACAAACRPCSIVAALGPVIAVSVVAVVLIFSSIEQGVEFEAVRGLQVARGLFLQQVQQLAARAADLGDDSALLRAHTTTPVAVRQRLGELSQREPALFETTDATGRVIARCSRGSCDEVPGGGVAGAAARRSVAGHPARAQLRTHGQRRALARSAGRARRAAAGRSGDATARRRDRDRRHRRHRGRPAEGGAGRRPRGRRLHRQRPQRVDVHGRHRRASGRPSFCRAGSRWRCRARGRRSSRWRSTATRTRSRSGNCRTSTPSQVGLLGVAVDREPLAAARRRASTTLVLGAMSALLLAIALSNLLARRMTRPLQDLHAGALAVARGDLDTSIAVDTDDEIGDVAEAFRIMTRSLRENQEGLAARVRELVTVHQVGRAVSSVVDLGQVLRVGHHRDPERARRQDRRDRAGGRRPRRRAADVRGARGRRRRARANAWRRWRARSRRCGRPRRTPAVEADPQLMEYARVAGLRGPIIAAPLTLKERMVGVIVVGRLGEAPFAEADLRLLVTFADQTATAIENARLYTEVRAFSEVLEARVRARTAELEKANSRDRARAARAGRGAGAADSLREDGRPRHAGRRHRPRGELAGGGGAGAGRRVTGDGAAPGSLGARSLRRRPTARVDRPVLPPGRQPDPRDDVVAR